MSDLPSLLSRRVVFTEDLRAYNFMREKKSLTTPFSGVFVPPGTNHVYPIKGRFFLKQQADVITGYVDDKNGAQINGSITAVEKKMTFDMRIHWVNMDYTTIGVTKGSDGESDKLRLGHFDGDRMTFPFYHSTYQVGTDDGYLNSSSTRGSLWRLTFSDEKEAVLDKVVETFSRFQKLYKNISLKVRHLTRTKNIIQLYSTLFFFFHTHNTSSSHSDLNNLFSYQHRISVSPLISTKRKLKIWHAVQLKQMF